MKEFFLSLKKFINDNKLAITAIGLGILLALSLIFLGKSLAANSQLKKQANQNITALTDSIEYYKTKNGNLVAEKTLLVGDMELLEQANKELSDKIEEMKIKNPQQVIYFETVIDNSTHDTAWIVEDLDTTIMKEFNFDNNWRELSGNVKFEDKNLSLSIENDKVFLDYTLAIKDNKVYLMSENPYVSYNEVQGITLPQQKKKHFGIGVGPSLTYGYDVSNSKPVLVPGISVGLFWNFIQF